MRAYLINLDRATERLAAFSRQAERIGLDFERIAAVDASTIVAVPPGMSPPAVACFASHRVAWQKLVAGDHAWCAVFEDDVHLSPDVVGLLADERWIPHGAALVKLETFSYPIKVRRKGVAVGGRRKLHELLTYHCGTGGYVISRECARTLLAVTANMERPVDDVMFDLAVARSLDLAVLQLVPAVCVQDCVLAEIEGRAVLHESQMQSVPKVTPPRLKGMAKLARELGRIGRQARDFAKRIPQGTAWRRTLTVPYEP
ncbi:glycosyltransferase family 25 protein [Kaistia granuli]|uniref:glycosyltransferase family 25 protein n=1 Tax=Kaistia granuli TaxID=363259 RepID=UPI00036C8962|nr:glycosyltransferase family 25 protein [Kaistia granuli]